MCQFRTLFGCFVISVLVGYGHVMVAIWYVCMAMLDFDVAVLLIAVLVCGHFSRCHFDLCHLALDPKV